MDDELQVSSEIDSTTVEAAEAGLAETAETTGAEKPETTGTPETKVDEAPETTETAEIGQTVPKERFDEVNNQLGEMKSRMDLMEQNNAIRAANVPAPAAADDFDIYKEAGVSDNGEDSISVDQHKKTLDYQQKTTQAQIDDIRFHVQNPDFTKLVGTTEQINSQEWAPAMAAALKENPALLQQIIASPNPKQLALTIARSAEAKAPGEAMDDADDVVNEAIRNAKRPKSVKTVRGGGGTGGEHRYSTMTDDAFIAMARSNGANV